MKCMMHRMVIIGCLVVFWGLMPGSKNVSGAEAPADFFRGKTIVWISPDVGSSVDLITRITAPFLAKEIGAKVKVENRKTDEGFNYLYNKGSRDGLTIGIKTTTAIIANDILKAGGVQYETDKFNFVAEMSPSITLFQISPKLPYKTLAALRKAKGLRGGASSAKGFLALSSSVMFEILGLDGKVITGFKGTKELALTIARGEIDFMVASDDVAMKDERDGYVVNLFAIGDKRSVVVPHAPALSELGVKVSKEMEAAHKFVVSGGSAVALPPGVAPERVEYLRKVFQALSNNKELQKALETLTGEWRPFVSGEKLQEKMVVIKSDKELENKLDALLKKYTAVH